MDNSQEEHYIKKITFKDMYPVFIVLAVILALLLVFAINIYNYILGYKYNMYTYEVNDFKKYEDSLERVAKWSYEYFDKKHEEDNELERMVLDSVGDKWRLSLIYSDDNKNSDEYVIMTENDIDDYKQIREAFNRGDNSLFGIYIHKNRVMFISCFNYALIYSVDGAPPTYINVNEESTDIFYQKLAKHWYQCVEKQ